MILRQSTAVAIDGRALLIEGPPGSGKSSLALALIDRGATLIGDDGVSLQPQPNRLMVGPAPATEGLIELRGIGLFTMPTTRAPAALVLQLDVAPDRLPALSGSLSIAGQTVHAIGFDAGNPAAAVRAEFALQRFGMPIRSFEEDLPWAHRGE